MVFRFLRPDADSVWKDEQIAVRFKNYKRLLDGKSLARYLIAKSLSCDYNPNDSTKDLEKLLRNKSKEFKELLEVDVETLKKRDEVKCSYLSLIEEIAQKYLTECNFCERECKIDRTKGEKGYCMVPQDAHISSAFLHMGEESVLVPSGTIFFQRILFDVHMYCIKEYF
ncbi:MAG: hypothetical protein ACFE8P_07385 [Promethearchaeota archaeon]